MPLEPADANGSSQLINRRCTRSSTIVTSNKRASEWAALLGDEILAPKPEPGGRGILSTCPQN